ncbi:hypothetical protein D3C73_931550 [compost metagenome]
MTLSLVGFSGALLGATDALAAPAVGEGELVLLLDVEQPAKAVMESASAIPPEIHVFVCFMLLTSSIIVMYRKYIERDNTRILSAFNRAQ